MSIADAAKASEFFLADGVIVTGGSTGQANVYEYKVIPSLCILKNLDST